MDDGGTENAEDRVYSGWQQAGVIGLEFAASEVGTLLSFGAGLFVMGPEEGGAHASTFVPAELTFLALGTTLSTIGVSSVGHAFGQHRPWEHAAAWAALGTACTALTCWAALESGNHWLVLAVPVSMVLPALGAVVGYNSFGGLRRFVWVI